MAKTLALPKDQLVKQALIQMQNSLAGVVAVFKQYAASERQLLTVGPRIIRQGVLHLDQRLFDQLVFGEC